MPQQLTVAVENNFTKGLITESTGLNFPENASTDTDNCEYTLVGDVLRRQGFDLEANNALFDLDRSFVAIHTYKWDNVGGDGVTQLLVTQVGPELYFWSVTAATATNPLSKQRLSSVVQLNPWRASGIAVIDNSLECEFASGNGYLFIFHPQCDPVYCTYSAGVVTALGITVKIRDFSGVPETIGLNDRPVTLSAEHAYNLTNQGWVSGSPWSAASSSNETINLGAHSFTVPAGITGVSPGQSVRIFYTGTGFITGAPPFGHVTDPMFAGTVTSYAGTTMIISVSAVNSGYTGLSASSWNIIPINSGYINTWNAGIGNYPSNSDIWWYYKNSSDVFDPVATIANVTTSGPAPKGHYILDAFNQQRDIASGQVITDIVSSRRPSNGTWFQGRVWYTGVNSQQPATGDAPYYTWTENIYFSQIVTTTDQFGMCYQVNDPTSETLFDILPTDGGVITIQGCGAIYKLFPIQNGLLVFAANGVWFITGSTGIGFTAVDYTITKISNIQSISSTTFVNVMGLPYFWNEEGIYQVEPSKNGGLEVNAITVGTILGFYNQIPLSSKKYARGDYHPIDYVIQWIYLDEEAHSIDSRYNFNRMLNYNVYNKAFYPYSVDTTIGRPTINSINYVAGPGGTNTPEPCFKYFTSVPGNVIYQWTFSDELSEEYVDWGSRTPTNYESFFITGYKLRGQAIKKFQPQYIQMYSRTNSAASAYKIQGLWDWANHRDSNRWSTQQVITNGLTRFDTVYRRHKIRGRGYALQFKITSVDDMPFDIQGWAISDTVNQSV